MDKELIDYFNGNELAASVWLSKYAQPGDKTPDCMHKRMAKELFKADKKFQKDEPIRYGSSVVKAESKLSDYGFNRVDLTEGDIYRFMKDFKYIVPQGSIMSQLGNSQIGSLSNCFVIGQPHDSYSGIFQKDQEQTQLMKRRGGVGQDLSTLRPRGVSTSNAAKTSTGAVSFMERFSNSTREVAQDGRRGALMLSIDVRHPDSPEFAVIKNNETKVTGANISIFLNNEFMEAVEENADYILRWPVNQDLSYFSEEYLDVPYNTLSYLEDHKNEDKIFYIKKVKAKELYETIIDSAWQRAEPGLLYVDRFHDYSPDGVYEQFKGVTTNPCGEIFMQPYDACRLMALNLYSFVVAPFTDNAHLDYQKLYRYSFEMQRLMDNIVDLELEHIDRILKKIDEDVKKTMEEGMSYYEAEDLYSTEANLWNKVRNVAESGRRTGSGITALGDTLAALGVAYDSPRGLDITEKIFKMKMKAELDCTIDLAILRGPFKGWDADKEFDLIASNELVGANKFYNFIAEEFPLQADRMFLYGRRNVSWSTVAPTGTVSLMTMTTSGLEPIFSGFYTRRVKINPGQEGKRVDFIDKNGDHWMEMPVLHPKFEDWISLTYNISREDIQTFSSKILEDYFYKSPWFGSTANDIDWVKRVEIQAIIQKYISHSISSTINLPNSVTKAEVAEIYTQAWKQGLKGVTVYRDGCRSGVLISNESKEDSFKYVDAAKRPKELECEIFTTTSAGKKYNVIVGLMEGKPYEVFLTNFFTKETKSTLSKASRGAYNLVKDGEILYENFTTEMSEEEEAITRMISTSLRHRTNIKFIVEQLNKIPSENMFSFVKSLVRVLKKYIPDGEKSTLICDDCGGSNVIFEEGCNKCQDCGDSKC